MKSTMRIAAALLAALLLVNTAALAEIDLQGMSDDEVIALLESVNGEIAARGIEKTADLPSGTYIGGRDLPVGKYIYTCRAKGDDWGSVTVYTDGGEKQLLWEVVSAPEGDADPDTFLVTLGDGDELKSGVPFSLTIMPGIIFR